MGCDTNESEQEAELGLAIAMDEMTHGNLKMEKSRLPSAIFSYAMVAKEGQRRVHRTGAERLKAFQPHHILPLGPSTVGGLCQWPKRCVESLMDANEIDLAGHPCRPVVLF